MPDTPTPRCSILVLAGGRGARLHGVDKGLQLWQGQPLISWLWRMARPLTDDLIISCNRNHDRYRTYADQLVSDDESDFPGPLAGIRTGLKVARHPRVVVLPCDSPLVDASLVNALIDAAHSAPAMIRQGHQWQPLMCCIPTRLGQDLESAWQQGERSPLRWLLGHELIEVSCDQTDNRLANFNTPDMFNRTSSGS